MYTKIIRKAKFKILMGAKKDSSQIRILHQIIDQTLR